MIFSCAKILWSANGLRPSEVQTLMTASSGRAGLRYRVDVDLLGLYHKGYSFANATHASAADLVIKKIRMLAYEGYQVRLVIDGPTRPDCKRSSWERIAELEFSKVNGHFARQMALSKAAALEACDSVAERKKLEAEIKSLNAESKSLQNCKKFELPKDLIQDIEDRIHNVLYSKDGYDDTNVRPYIIQAKFQADSLICQRILSGETDIALTEDTDFLALLGPEHFILRKIEKSSVKGAWENRCEIAGTSEKMFNRFKQLLTSHDRITWKPAKYHILDTPSPKLRSLIAITLGCDVWKGIRGVGPDAINKFLDKLPSSMTLEQKEEAFIVFMIRKHENDAKTKSLRKVDRFDLSQPVFDKAVVDALVSAYMDEPAVKFDNRYDTKWKYMHGAPSSLCKYLYYFSEFGHIDVGKLRGSSEAVVIETPLDHALNGSAGGSSEDHALDGSAGGSSEEKDDKKSESKRVSESGVKKPERNFTEPFDFDNPGVVRESPFELPKDTAGVESDLDMVSSFSGNESIGSNFNFDIVDDEEPNSRKKSVMFAADVKPGKLDDSHDDESDKNGGKNDDFLVVGFDEKDKKTESLVCVNESVLSAATKAETLHTATVATATNTTKGNTNEQVCPEANDSTELSNIRIVVGPPVGWCFGLSGKSQPHYYLEVEGSHFCYDCGVSFCRTCGYVPELLTPAKKKKSYFRDKNKSLCFGCFKTCNIIEEDGQDLDDEKDMKEMRKKLRSLNVKLQDDAMLHEVEEMYEHYVNVQPLYERISEDTHYPLHDAGYFDRMKSSVFWTGPIFSPSGFLDDPRLSPEDIFEIIKLMSSFVTYKRPEDSPYASAVPSNIIDFANGSRPSDNTAHKMIKSAMRHALDERLVPIIDRDFSLFRTTRGNDNVLGLILQNTIPPSMKQKQYDTKIAITIHDLLACCCTCLSSGKDTSDDRVSCVHCLPLMYQVSLLLHSGLALHFLHDLAARWNGDMHRLLLGSVGRHREARKCILNLIRASNPPHATIVKAEGTHHIDQILSHYQVTTEKEKVAVVTPPKKHEIIPFRQLPVESVLARAKRRKNGECAVGSTSATNVASTPSRKIISDLKVESDSESSSSGSDTDSSSSDDESIPDLEPRYGHKVPPAASSTTTISPSAQHNSEVYELYAHRMDYGDRAIVRSAGEEDMPEHVSYAAFRQLINEPVNGLRFTKWLNDEIMNAYLKLLTNMDAVQNPDSRTYIFDHHFFYFLHETNRGYDYEGVKNWANKYPHIDIFTTLKQFIIPINIQNQHWSMITITFEGEKLIEYIDSMGLDGMPLMNIFLRYLEDYARDHNLPFNRSEWKMRNRGKRAPQQANSDDCGVFVLNNAYLLVQNVPLLYSQRGVDACESRKIIGLSILKGLPLCPITVVRGTAPRPRNEIDDDMIGRHYKKYKTSAKKMSSKEKALLAVKEDEESRPNVELPDFGSFVPDYTRVYGWLKAVFPGRDVPTNLVGYCLIGMRAKAERSKLEKDHGKETAKKVIRKKETNAYFDYKNAIKLANNNDIHTDNLIVNQNGKTQGENSMATYRRYACGTNRTCSYKGCYSTTKTGVSFEKLPSGVSEIDDDVLHRRRPRDIVRYYKKKLLFEMARENCGLPLDPKKDYRICALHKKKLVSVKKVVERPEKKPLNMKFTFCVPEPVGLSNNNNSSSSSGLSPRQHSRGLGGDRAVIKQLENMPDDRLKDMTLFAMVSSEVNDINNRRGTAVNETVRSILRMEDSRLDSQLKISSSVHQNENRRGDHVRSFDMTDGEIKSKTGFPTKAHLLGFTAIVCNGNITAMVGTMHAALTWWEEWFLAYEQIWGRSWVNQCDLAKEYHVNPTKKNEIVDDKLRKILICRNSYPRYCSHEEDVSLRADKWIGVIDDSERIIEHDTTNVRMTFKPSLASSQKITYNRYFGGPSAKGDVELQICGWMNTNHLFVGAVSDSQYMIQNRIFERQQQFQKSDLVNKNEVPFTNVLDRGYQLHLHAKRCGNQSIFQPMFRKKGTRFTGDETLRSASCASVRSGNERAVRKAKIAGFLRKGLRPNESPRRLDDIWLAWGFMCNFIYMSTA